MTESKIEIVKYVADGYALKVYKPLIEREIKTYICGRIETQNAYTARLWREQGLAVTERVERIRVY